MCSFPRVLLLLTCCTPLTTASSSSSNSATTSALSAAPSRSCHSLLNLYILATSAAPFYS
jgi:hypothetical protein